MTLPTPVTAMRLEADSDPLRLPITAPGQISKSLDQGVIAEVVEHNKRGRYPSDKTPDEYLLPPIPNSYCVVYRFIYLYLLVE